MLYSMKNKNELECSFYCIPLNNCYVLISVKQITTVDTSWLLISCFSFLSLYNDSHVLNAVDLIITLMFTYWISDYDSHDLRIVDLLKRSCLHLWRPYNDYHVPLTVDLIMTHFVTAVDLIMTLICYTFCNINNNSHVCWLYMISVLYTLQWLPCSYSTVYQIMTRVLTIWDFKLTLMFSLYETLD